MPTYTKDAIRNIGADIDQLRADDRHEEADAQQFDDGGRCVLCEQLQGGDRSHRCWAQELKRRRGRWTISEVLLRGDGGREVLELLKSVATPTSEHFDHTLRVHCYEGFSPHFEVIGDDEEAPEYQLWFTRLEDGSSVFDRAERLWQPAPAIYVKTEQGEQPIARTHGAEFAELALRDAGYLATAVEVPDFAAWHDELLEQTTANVMQALRDQPIGTRVVVAVAAWPAPLRLKGE